MLSSYKYICIALLVGFLSSCDDAKYDTKAIAQEIKNRQVKRITEPKLLRWVKIKGAEIALQAQKALLRELYALQNDNKIKSLQEYKQINLAKLPIIDSLQKTYPIKISIQAHKTAQTNEAKFSADKTKIYYWQNLVLENQEVGQWQIIFDKKQTILNIKSKEINQL